jgi:DNA-binding NtrC family response regulator
VQSTTLNLLSLSPFEDDHLALETIVGHSRWMLFRTNHLPLALSILRQHEISVVLTERDLQPEPWTTVLAHLKDLPHPPSLIVTSRLADDKLWAEALNLGAWDVLAKPFDRIEVLRVVKSAWEHWHYDTGLSATMALRATS